MIDEQSSLGGGGGSAKIGDGCGALVVLKEESTGEAAGGKMGMLWWLVRVVGDGAGATQLLDGESD